VSVSASVAFFTTNRQMSAASNIIADINDVTTPSSVLIICATTGMGDAQEEQVQRGHYFAMLTKWTRFSSTERAHADHQRPDVVTR